MKFKLWSNLLFLVPLYTAVINSVFWYTTVLTIVFLFSTSFHYFNEKKFKKTDTFSSLSLITSNFVLLFMGSFKFPFGLSALLFASVAIGFYARQFKYGYNFNHGMWHIFSAMTCYFSILTYLYK